MELTDQERMLLSEAVHEHFFRGPDSAGLLYGLGTLEEVREQYGDEQAGICVAVVSLSEKINRKRN